MFFLMFNYVFLPALLYVLLPSGVINHVCMYVCITILKDTETFQVIFNSFSILCLVTSLLWRSTVALLT